MTASFKEAEPFQGVYSVMSRPRRVARPIDEVGLVLPDRAFARSVVQAALAAGFDRILIVQTGGSELWDVVPEGIWNSENVGA